MKIGLIPRIVSLGIALLISVAFLISFIALHEIDKDIQKNIASDQAQSLRTAAIIFSDKMSNFSVNYDSKGNVEKIIATEIPDFVDHSIIDTVGHITG